MAELKKHRSEFGMGKFYFLLLVNAFVAFSSVTCIQLDEDGYYHDIVVAVSDKTAQSERDDYIDNLKTGIQDLGDALFESTKGNFSIRAVDILVPSHWEVEGTTFASGQSFRNADIKISHEYLVPQAVNPMGCAYPGNYIEIPYSFFEEKEGPGSYGPYGPSWKALLLLWARFRWGVYEEHGVPVDPRFPYFWKAYRLPEDPEDKVEDWRVSNCVNVPLEGKYENFEGNECGPAVENGLYPPNSDCRFFPDQEQKATSSLMSFSFVESLTEFCDESTHDRRAPTRQNHFCLYKSVWEIIKLTPDWKKLREDSKTERTRISYRVMKKTERPLLYILTDGVNQPPPEVVDGISTGLDEMFSETRNWNVVAGIGVFPAEDLKDSFDTVYRMNSPWHNKAEFISTFTSALGSREGFRNFGAAIQDVGNEIKDMEHSQGAVILVVKHGTESPEFASYLQEFEGEVLGTIVEQNIQVIVIEGADDLSTTNYRLKQLAEMSGGQHFEIGVDETENKARVAAAMSAVDDALKLEKIPESNYILVYRELILGDMSTFLYEMTLHHGMVKNIKFFFHQTYSEWLTPMVMPPEFWSGGGGGAFFDVYDNWGKPESMLMSFYAEDDMIFDETTFWEYTVDCMDQGTCNFIMIAIAERDTSQQVVLQHEVSVSVSTSVDADNYVANLYQESAASLKGTAFSIYAKLEKNGHSISNPDIQVIAHVQLHFRDQGVMDHGGPGKTVVLVDDGKGAPDMIANDGIYSGNFVPWTEPDADLGVSKIYVTASLMENVVQTRSRPIPVDRKVKTRSQPIPVDRKVKTRSQPIPVDQKGIGCGSFWQNCWREEVTEPFMVHADLKRRIEFYGSLSYTGTGVEEDPGLQSASRIIDLGVIPDGRQNIYHLTWTEPFMEILGGRTNARSFQIFYTEDFNHISHEDQNQFLSEIADVPPAGRPGQPASFEIPASIDLLPGRKLYFVMRARGNDPNRVPLFSNVAFLETMDPYETTTTTPSPIPTTVPTATTTRRAAKPSSPTTVPTLRTTTGGTTETTTWRTVPTTTTTTRTTTTGPSTVSTTTQRVEVTTEKIKYWYQSTGAIAAFSAFGGIILLLGAGAIVYVKFLKP